MEDFELPSMFIKAYWQDGDQVAGGGTTFIVLREEGDDILLGEFGMVEEAGYITNEDDGFIFEMVNEDHIDKPPFRRVFSMPRDELIEDLESGAFFYGEAIQEAWENYSEGGSMRLCIDGDEREFNIDHQRLTEYERGY